MAAKKFDFKKAVTDLLFAMGGQISVDGPGGYTFVMETAAGPLRVQVHDDWLAARFDDVSAATKLVATGSLNKFSGKWNWHYTKPTFDDVVELARELAGVLVDDEDLEECIGDGEPGENTAFRYGYRDADNYNTNAQVVLRGGFTRRDVRVLIACSDRDGHNYFIPGQVGLSDLQDSFADASMWLDERDHPYHEIHAIEPIDAAASDDAMTVKDLVAKFVAVACDGSWDDNYKPAAYEVMKSRAEAQGHA